MLRRHEEAIGDRRAWHRHVQGVVAEVPQEGHVKLCSLLNKIKICVGYLNIVVMSGNTGIGSCRLTQRWIGVVTDRGSFDMVIFFPRLIHPISKHVHRGLITAANPATILRYLASSALRCYAGIEVHPSEMGSRIIVCTVGLIVTTVFAVGKEGTVW